MDCLRQKASVAAAALATTGRFYCLPVHVFLGAHVASLWVCQLRLRWVPLRACGGAEGRADF